MKLGLGRRILTPILLSSLHKQIVEGTNYRLTMEVNLTCCPLSDFDCEERCDRKNNCVVEMYVPLEGIPEIMSEDCWSNDVEREKEES